MMQKVVEGKGQKSEKWEEMGRVRMKMGDLGKRKEMDVTRRLPIRLQSAGGSGVSVATLTVVVSIAADDGGESSKAGLFRWMSFSKKMNDGDAEARSPDSCELTRSNSLSSLETHSSGGRRGFWGRTGSFFSGSRRKIVKKMDGRDESDEHEKKNYDEKWEVKEIMSRDGEVELKCSVGLASFDQCSAKVAGEGACSVIATVVAYWLHLNKGKVPNRAELDQLMVEGAAEWKKLGEMAAYSEGFPDKHFDIETVIKVGIRPLGINQESSVVGFFSPEKFELLKGAVCFDGIWNDIERKAGVYIVSWNDHFCVLKVEHEACYLIDSLGKRLTEGCTQAFTLRFDESSVMKHRSKISSQGDAKSKPHDTSCTVETEASALGEVKVEDEKIICRGRECCKEFFKRFHAAVIVKQLEVKEEMAIVGSSDLHKKLQIEFQYTTSFKK